MPRNRPGADPLPGIAAGQGGHGEEIGQGEEQADRQLDRGVARGDGPRHPRHRPPQDQPAQDRHVVAGEDPGAASRAIANAGCSTLIPRGIR